MRVRERLSATPGHVIGQGPAPGGGVVTRGGSGGSGGEWPYNLEKLVNIYELLNKTSFVYNMFYFLDPDAR